MAKGKKTDEETRAKVTELPNRKEFTRKMIAHNEFMIKTCNEIIRKNMKRFLNESITYLELQDIRKMKEDAKCILEELGDENERHIKPSLRYLILKRDNFTCQYCGSKAPDVALQIDHKIPYSKGGKTNKENLVVACFHCNIGKSNNL